MTGKLFFKDIAEGQALPEPVKRPSTRQLVRWAGASGDYFAIHYDKDFAVSQGLDGVIVHGQLVACFLAELCTLWAGDPQGLKKLSVSYRGINYPGQDIICRGRVSGKYEEAGEHFVKCSLWAENPSGEKTVTARAVIGVSARG